MLPELFPLLTALIRADYAPPEVLQALSDLLLQRVGPMVGAQAPSTGGTAAALALMGAGPGAANASGRVAVPLAGGGWAQAARNSNAP